MLETRRLSLTPFQRSEVSDLFAIRGDPKAMAFWDSPFDASLEETHKAARFMFAEVERKEALYWTARCKDDGLFVGIFDLSDLLSEAADLGFMIVGRLEGRGYAFEAASRILEEARARRFLKLKARIHAGNVRSCKLLQRLGFSLRNEADVEIRKGVRQRCSFFILEL